MLKAKQIPQEAVEAAAKAVYRVGFDRDPLPDDLVDQDRLDFARRYARAAIAASIAAWPGVTTEHREILNFGNNIDGPVVSAKRVPFLIFPLQQQEPRDD